jgi:SAM-dependent methyltransferase
MTTPTNSYYPESRFGGFTDIDGTIIFFARIRSLVDAESTVLDVGCGRGAAHSVDPVPFRRNLRNLRGTVRRVIGIDVDEAARENPMIDEFRKIEGPAWPIEDNSIDLVMADNVLEHLPDPPQFFAEARRVLKDGRYLCIRTPNRWSYIGIASSLVPNRHHRTVLRAAQPKREEQDVFPTLYRCNSVRRIRAAMRKHGFDAVVYGYEAEPSYLGFSKVAYMLGVWHQRWAAGFMKPAIFGFGRLTKP